MKGLKVALKLVAFVLVMLGALMFALNYYDIVFGKSVSAVIEFAIVSWIFGFIAIPLLSSGKDIETFTKVIDFFVFTLPFVVVALVFPPLHYFYAFGWRQNVYIGNMMQVVSIDLIIYMTITYADTIFLATYNLLMRPLRKLAKETTIGMW